MNWLLGNWETVVSLAADHLLIAIPAIVASALIAVPIGRFAFTRPGIGGAVLSVAGLAYAIPALPLLIIIPAVIGTSLRSPATIIVALTVYGIALLVRTACDAFSAVDPQLRDAATAVGFSRRGLLWRVDLPLAVPVLISGLRVVTVSTISLVTLGALIGVPSLGSLLTDGFQRGIAAEVWTGIVATAVLALLLDAAVLGLGRVLAPWQRAAHGLAGRGSTETADPAEADAQGRESSTRTGASATESSTGAADA